MRKGQQGFHHILLVLVILVLGVVGFAGYRVFSKHSGSGSSATSVEGGDGPNYDALAACGSEPMLTKSPIDLTKLDQIAPLGAINPPDHTIPTDHMYFMYKYDRPASERYDLVAPGNLVVTKLIYNGKSVNGGPTEDKDFALDFAPCKGVSFRFGHVNSLSGPLQGLVGEDVPGAECRTDQPASGEKILYCEKTIDVKVSAGEVMGVLGAKYVAALDVGAHKQGYADSGLTSTKYYHGVNAVCPLDFFVEPVRQSMLALASRTTEPKCGVIGQDAAGTLQGTWFATQDAETAKADWNSHFTLAHHSGDPSIGIVAVAGKISDPGTYKFTPQHSGTTNVEPSETKTGVLYCYFHDNEEQYNGSVGAKGKVLLKLTDNHTMQAEHKDGTCGADEQFSSPMTYYR